MKKTDGSVKDSIPCGCATQSSKLIAEEIAAESSKQRKFLKCQKPNNLDRSKDELILGRDKKTSLGEGDVDGRYRLLSTLVKVTTVLFSRRFFLNSANTSKYFYKIKASLTKIKNLFTLPSPPLPP